jgi:hypothetical protein
MTQVHRYDPRAIGRAYLRCTIGLTLTLGPLLALGPSPWLSVLLLALAALFLAYLASTIALHTAEIVLDEHGIRCAGLFRENIEWSALTAMELNYYSTRADRSGGWMELVVRGGHRLIRVRSELAGFAPIAARVASEVLRRELSIDERSLAHLLTLGYPPDPVGSRLSPDPVGSRLSPDPVGSRLSPDRRKVRTMPDSARPANLGALQ